MNTTLSSPDAKPAGPVLVAGRECGDCAMCCKLPQIDVLNKKAGDWCVHCSTRAHCDAYETRPEPCRTFFCHFMENPRLGEEWRPSKSRFMLMGKDGGRSLMIVVDPARPDAWKKEPYLASFKDWATKMKVVINIGKRQMIVHPTHVQDLGEAV